MVKPSEVKKKVGKLTLALVIYLVLVFLLASAASIRLIFPQQVLRKILQSDYPNISLIVFSAAVVAALWFLVKLGLEMTNFPIKFSKAALNKIRDFSFWYPVSCFSLATLVLALIGHPCQPPAVTFTLKNTQASAAVQPNVVITAAPNEMLIFTVSPVEEAAIGCIWSQAGSGITHLSQTSGCTSTVWLSSEPGNAILTVAVNEGICANRNNYSFPLLIRKP